MPEIQCEGGVGSAVSSSGGAHQQFWSICPLKARDLRQISYQTTVSCLTFFDFYFPKIPMSQHTSSVLTMDVHGLLR